MVPVYFHILEYRKIEPAQRVLTYPMLTNLHDNASIGWIMILTGLFIIVINLIGPYHSVVDPKSSSMTVNMIYYGLSRPAWVFGIACILLAILTRQFSIARSMLANKCLRLFSQAVAIGSLVVILVLQGILNSTYMESGLFVTFPFALLFGLGSIIASFAVAIVVSLFLEFPLRRLY